MMKFPENPLLQISTFVLALFLLAAVITEGYGFYCDAHNIVPRWAAVTGSPYSAPSSSHWLGTDYQGRDVLLRAVAGSASALKVGLISGIISLCLGVGFGVVSGFFRGPADDLTVWIYSTFASMPTLLFVLSFALLVSKDYLSPGASQVLNGVSSVLRVTPGTIAVYIAIGITGWVGLCRVIRAETMKLRRAPFIDAARCAGVGSFTIIGRHILPNIRHLALIYFTMNFGSAVLLEVLVSYLGLSGSNSAPGWGAMIASGQERLWRGVWWELAAAGGLMFLLILALNVFSDSLKTKDER